MPMPRPRILGSSRVKDHNSNHQNDLQTTSGRIRNQSSSERNCEIIKIEDDEDEKKVFDGSMTIKMSQNQSTQNYSTVGFVKHCPMRLPDYGAPPSQTISAQVSPALSLSFIPDTSMGLLNHAKNIYSNQSVVMVLPVNPVASQIFNAPTLCTLENIEKPNELICFKQVIHTQRRHSVERIVPSTPLMTNNRGNLQQFEQFANERKEIVQKLFMKNSVKEDSNSTARALIPWKRKENDLPVSNDQASSISLPIESVTNNISLDITNTLETMTEESSVNLEKLILPLSHESAITDCFNKPTDAIPLLEKSANNVSALDNEKTVISKINALSNKVDSSEIQSSSAMVSKDAGNSCSVSIERSLECLSKEPENMHSLDHNKELLSNKDEESKEISDITIIFENNERPFSPLTKITDKSSSFEEEIRAMKEAPGTLSLSENERPPNFNQQESLNKIDSSGNEEISIVDLQESETDIDSLRNEETSIVQTEETPEDVISSENKKISISMLQKQSMETKNRPIPPVKELSTCLSKEPLDNNDSSDSIESFSPISQFPESSPEKYKDKDKPRSEPDNSEENLAKEDSSVTKVIKKPNCQSVRIHLWKAQCISCKERFSDRNELHKHATLSHPDVQIIFCDLCSDSFFTDHELAEHRSVHDDRQTERHCETSETVTNDIKNDVSPSNKKSVMISDGKEISPKHRESSPGNSGVQNKKPRGRPRKQIMITNEPSMNFRNFRDVEEKKIEIKNDAIIAKDDSVEEDFIGHPAESTKKNIESAQMKKLVVPLKRLEGPLLEKYMEKLSTKPVIASHKKRVIKRKSLRANKGKRKESPDYSNTIRNPRRGKKKIHWTKLRHAKLLAEIQENRSASFSGSDSDEMMENKKSHSKLRCDDEFRKFFKKTGHVSADSTNSDNSDIEFVSKTYLYEMPELPGAKNRRIESRKKKSKETNFETANSYDENGDLKGFVESDSMTKYQKVIRKLPSRSSAASISKVKMNRVVCESEKIKRKINGRDGEWSCKSAKKIRDSPMRENIPIHKEHKISHTSLNRNSLMGSEAKLGEQSYQELEDFEEVEEFEVLEEIEISEEFKESDNEATTKKEKRETSIGFNSSKETKIPSVPRSSITKTYLPSKRRFETTEKFKQEAKRAKLNPIKPNDLCFMCKALLRLMKRITAQFESKNPRESTVPCPFCNLDFISMFYLEEHIAGNHYYCKNERPCKRAKNLVYDDEKLDCETEIELSVKCSQCFMKFSNEEDLNDHITTDHDKSTSLKNTYMANTPNYLVDFSSFCLQTDGDEKLDEATHKNHRNDAKKNVSKEIIEVKKAPEVHKNPSKSVRIVTCWLCDLPFSTSLEYAEHMAKIHQLLEPVKKEKISSPKLNPTDQIESDRKYVLKQLLSDDSMDGFEEVETSEIHKESKEVVEIVEENAEGTPAKRIVGRLSSAHTCKICFKAFNRAQDLLMHRLSHSSNPSEKETTVRESVEYKNRTFSDELFVDPPTNDTMDLEKFAVIKEKESNIIFLNETATIENSLINSKILTNNREDTKPKKVEPKESPAKVKINARQQAEIAEKLNNSSNRTSTDSKKSSSKKTVSLEPEALQQRNEKRDTLKELLDTENGLANTDETIANDKVPIECSKCNRKFPNREALNEHLFFLHDDTLKDTVFTDILKIEDETEPHWICEPCEQEFKMLQGYSRHRYKIHGDDSMVHICENCCKILTNVTMVNVHICTDVASYNCRTCNETFTTGMSLRLHNLEKHEETDEPNICYPCNKKFLTKSMLKRHEKAQHRFIRLYRSRSSSPVRMATEDNFFTSEEETPARILDESDEFSLFFNDDENAMDLDFERTESTIKNNKKKALTSSKIGLARRRRKSQEKSLNDDNETPDLQDFDKSPEELSNTMCIDEKEIHQCRLCDLYCLTTAALENHKATIHSGIPKVCQLCHKVYAEKKLIKHMIDEHIDPCETYSGNSSTRDFGQNRKERDTQVFVKMLGIKRFAWLWEYHRYTESTETSTFNCSSCNTDFPSNSEYKSHFFERHDSMCMLCNIEFKSGEDAAKHKKEEHRSAECYLWFVDKTLSEVARAENIHKLVERICFDLISQEKMESGDCNEESVDDTNAEESSETGECGRTITTGEMNAEENTISSEDLEHKQEDEEENDQDFIIIVTDEDLEKYKIGTQYPNIWGLASQISSTCKDLTPTDVKETLEKYFEK